MKVFLLLITLPISILTYAQETLDNNSILEMIELEFDETLIIDKIENSDNKFETTINALGELKKKGVSQNILSVMIKSSKKNNDTDEVDLLSDNENNLNNGSELNNLKYTFTNGINTYTIHLMKNEYFKELKGPPLENLINFTIISAKFELKHMSTYKPHNVQLIRTKNGKNKIAILGTAQNDYGATVDSYYEEKFTYNPDLINSKKNGTLKKNPLGDKEYMDELFEKINTLDYRLDENNKHFTYKYVSINGAKTRIKGNAYIGEDYIVITAEPMLGMSMPDIKMPLIKLNDNESESKIEIGGQMYNNKYNSVPSKYKSTGGTFTMSSPLSDMVYYLIADE